MALPTNNLVQVQTYQRSNLAYLLNLCCFVSTANTKFKDFQNKEANLGDTVTFDLPPRYVAANSLNISFQESTQRVQTLACKQQGSVGYAFSNQQFVFNVSEYMDMFGKSAIIELANNIESNVAKNVISGVPTTSGSSISDNTSGPYRFYGDGVTPINSYGQLAQMLANFRDYGATVSDTKVYLPSVSIPAIVNSGLNQFVTDRNNEIAQSWWIGDFSRAKFYESNLLPIHRAGTVGNAVAPSNTLTVVSTNDPTGAAITQITFSGAGVSDLSAIKSGDLAQFIDGVSGQPNIRFLTFNGHSPSSQPVQFRVLSDAGSDGSTNVTVSVTPTLCSQSGNAIQNITSNIVAGMKATFLPDHKAGVVIGGSALYLAMPKLPNLDPYPTSNESDPDTGVSLRQYHGVIPFQNQIGMAHDAIWGSTIVPEYSMRVIFPV
jgi:hypothetical protein